MLLCPSMAYEPWSLQRDYFCKYYSRRQTSGKNRRKKLLPLWKSSSVTLKSSSVTYKSSTVGVGGGRQQQQSFFSENYVLRTDVTCNFPSVLHLRIQAQLLGEEHTAAEIKVCTCCFSLKNRAIFNKDREWLLRIICNKMITALCVPKFQNKKKKSQHPFLCQSRGNVPNGQYKMRPFSRLSSPLCLKDTFHVCLSEPTVSNPRQVMEEQKELQQWSNPVLLPSSSTVNSEKERELQCNGP